MTYWIRELAGWLLVGLGLLSYLTVYEFCQRHWIFEAGIFMVVGTVVFRGGVHLLKVAVAGRLVRQAQEHLYPSPPAGTGPRPNASGAARRPPQANDSSASRSLS